MFIVYFALWVIFNGKWTTEIGVFGVIFAAVLYAFSCRFMGYSLKTDLRMARGFVRGVRYIALLIEEIVKANAAVIGLILRPGAQVEPQLVRFTTGVQQDNHRVVLADSITLTPGTITCELQDGRYLVHCLDKSLAEGIERSSFVDALMAMEGAGAQAPEADEPEESETEAVEAAPEANEAEETEEAVPETEETEATVPEADDAEETEEPAPGADDAEETEEAAPDEGEPVDEPVDEPAPEADAPDGQAMKEDERHD